MDLLQMLSPINNQDTFPSMNIKTPLIQAADINQQNETENKFEANNQSRLKQKGNKSVRSEL